ncbi:MAG TPA: DNA primase [Candidatus Babeliales bacterium]|nr:DNA primase [Candidatus Babeliales bacterium]
MNLFSFIKARIPILDVVNEYVTLKRAGGYHKGTCPFHHEKTASFTVSPDKEIFYCFGCHISGDVISFIAKIENCSQKDAAKLLAEKYNVELPKNIAFELSDKSNEEKNHYFAVCKAVALWCHEQLLKNNVAQSYVKKRSFGPDTFDYFTLGYFPSGNASISDLLYCMKQQSILPRDLIEAHILAEGRTTLYSPFEDRLIFPIKDILGRYCGFGGRIFKEHDTRPKYYNSRENEYFIKGSLLFNLDKAKKSIQETGKIFLVEGYTDCIAMIQHGLPNTVATLGTACTIEHLKQLARYAEHIYVVYDGDTAGKQAVLRLTELCWQVNLELKVILLPQGDDPASFFIKNGDMQALIHSAQDIFFFFIDSLGHNFINKPLSQKINTTRTFISTIATIGDPLKKDILLQKAAKTFDIPFESLKEELQRSTAQGTPSAPVTAPETISQTETISLLEKRIFCAIMNNVQLLQGESRLRLIKYLPAPLRDILAKLKEAKEKTEIVTFGLFFDTLNEHEKQYVSKLLLEQEEIIDAPAFDKLLEQLQKKQWKIIVRDIQLQLARAKQEGDAEKISLILRDLMELQSTFITAP